MSRIMIVDDSWLARKTMAKIIESLGHEVVQAEDGKEALEIIADSAPDCLLLDLLMPTMDGFQVMEALNEKAARIPVIILSADIQITSQERCFQLGAVDFITKPPTKADMAAALDKALPGNSRGYE